MWQKMKDVRACLLVFALAIGLAACSAPAPIGAPPRVVVTEGGSSRDPQPATAPYAASDFTVTTFEGDTFHLAEQKGTPVVLNFWESW